MIRVSLRRLLQCLYLRCGQVGERGVGLFTVDNPRRSARRNVFIRGKKLFRFVPSNLPERRQHFLKAASRTARAEIIATELLVKLFGPVNDSVASFHLCFGWETFATFAGNFES